MSMVVSARTRSCASSGWAGGVHDLWHWHRLPSRISSGSATDVKQFVGPDWPHVGGVERDQGHRVAAAVNKLDLVTFSAIVNVHDRANVTAAQFLVSGIAIEHDERMFFHHRLSFGRIGCNKSRWFIAFDDPHRQDNAGPFMVRSKNAADDVFYAERRGFNGIFRSGSRDPQNIVRKPTPSASLIAERLEPDRFGFAFWVIGVQEVVANLFDFHDGFRGFWDRHTTGPRRTLLR
jgi:hypothetical protein